MTIKQECELLYKQIKEAETRLKEIRKLCDHKNVFEGNWPIGWEVIRLQLFVVIVGVLSDRYMPIFKN